MKNATQREINTFLRYPVRKLVGIVDTPQDLETALAALTEAGIDRGKVEVFSGEEGIRRIDPRGEHHGLLGRLTRIVQAIGEEFDHLLRYEQELHAGHFLVVVSVDRDDVKERARAVLERHGGHFVDYYGPLAIEHLVP